MDTLRAIIHFIVFQILDQAPVLLGLIALVGFLAQRSSFEETVEGVAKTIVGVLILSAGCGVLLNATFPVTDMLNSAFGVQGVIPSDEGAFAFAMSKLSTQIVSVFVLGFVIHVILVIITPVKSMKNLYLTGHMMLYFSTLSTLSWQWIGLSGTPLLIAAAITCALYWTLAPWWTFRYSRQFAGDDFTLGHHQHVCAWVGAVLGPLVGSKEQDAENLKLPKFLGMFNDFVMVMAVTMPVIFLVIGAVAGPAVVSEASGAQNWVIWLIMQGLQFAAGIGIIMMGVRMFLASVIPAFKGISDRIIPGVRPALDCPVFYPYSPTGAILGFLSALAGSVVVTLFLVVLGSPVIIFPGPIPFFFDGATAGVFGNKFGGWKGAIATGFLTGGVLTHLGAVPLYLMSGPLLGSGVVFSNTDTSTLIPLLFTVIKRGGGDVLGAPFFITTAIMIVLFVLGIGVARKQKTVSTHQ